MGCDIHIYVEIKEDGKWKLAQGLVDGDVPYPDQFYRGRNYNLFGFLAGVREPNLQHFQAKGFPTDASKLVSKVWSKDKKYCHTPSYLTLKELRDASWDDPIVVSGMMEGKRLAAIKKELKKKQPDYEMVYAKLLYPYCGWTNEKGYVNFRIEVPRRYEFRQFLEAVEHKLPYYGLGGTSDETRIVFWFDN